MIRAVFVALALTVSPALAQQGFYNGGVNTCSLSGPVASSYISMCYGYINGVPMLFAWQPPGSTKPLVIANGIGRGPQGNLYPGLSIDIYGNVTVVAGLRDSTGSLGTSGQTLVSTGTGIRWGNGTPTGGLQDSAGNTMSDSAGNTMIGSP